MKRMTVDPFKIYGEQWALVTAGSGDSFNTMTVSWGGLGTLWGRDVATIYIKPIRYTYQFIEKNEYFTVSFFPEQYHGDLLTLGTTSGRDGDKLARTALTPKAVGETVGFEQAETTLLCRKLYAQDLDPNQIPADAMEKFYANEPPHRMYIAEVINVL